VTRITNVLSENLCRQRFGVALSVEVDTGSLGEHLDGFMKFEALLLHHEAEDIAANIAHPAFPGLSCWIHLKAGAGIDVPRASRNVNVSLLLQRQITSN